jgi:hypothetical protein
MIRKNQPHSPATDSQKPTNPATALDDKSAHGPRATTNPPVPVIIRDTLPADLRLPIEEHNLFRAILLPARSVPATRLRLPAKSSRDERRKLRAHSALSAKV